MTTALLVIDMQQALCTGEEAGWGIDGVLAHVNALSRRARASGAPVIFVQHEEDDGPLSHGAPGWQLAAGLLTAADDLRLRKRTPDSFHVTELHRLLQQRHVTRLVVCGQQTECCVDTTVRRALPLGYAVCLAADAHTTVDGAISAAQAIAHHNRTLRGMTHFGPPIEVMPAAQVDFAA